MKTAIIYGRTSTNKQSAESIETQIFECKKWADENNCIIVDIYDDSGQSGRAYNVDNRDGFQQIKEDAKNGKMNYAIIHKIDRFARSVYDYLNQEKILLEYGVQIIVAGMPFMQNADIISKSVHIAMAEQFSTNLSNEVTTKMRTYAKKGAYLGGVAPYGYKIKTVDNEKKLVIDPAEAEGVKLAYKTYLKGYGYAATSKILAASGFLTKKGEPFSQKQIRDFLTNKKYNGCYVYGVHKRINGKDKKVKDKESIVEIPNAHDKIIEDELFNAVQARLSSNVTKNKRKKRFYPLTSFITCGCCGRSMVGYSSQKKRKTYTRQYVYYRCTGNKVAGCPVKAIKADLLENYIFDIVKEHIFDADFIENLIKQVESFFIQDINMLHKKKAKLKSELKEKNKQLKNALKDKYKGEIAESLYNQVVEEITQEKNDIETLLLTTTQQINIKDKTAEIRKFVESLQNSIKSAAPEIKNAVLQKTVKSIIVTNENIEIYLNILNSPPPKNTGGKFLSLNKPLFTLQPAAKSLDKIKNGVPLYSINARAEIFSSAGVDLIKFTLSAK